MMSCTHSDRETQQHMTHSVSYRNSFGGGRGSLLGEREYLGVWADPIAILFVAKVSGEGLSTPGGSSMKNCRCVASLMSG